MRNNINNVVSNLKKIPDIQKELDYLSSRKLVGAKKILKLMNILDSENSAPLNTSFNIFEELHKKKTHDLTDFITKSEDNAYRLAVSLTKKKKYNLAKDVIKNLEYYSPNKFADSTLMQKVDFEVSKIRRRKNILISLLSLFLLTSFIVVFVTYIVPEYKYKLAQTAIKENNYVYAHDCLNEIIPYKNSQSLLERISICNKYQRIKEGQVGDIVTYGEYEQDNDESNGKESIEWQIIEKMGDSVTLYSEKALVAAGGGNNHFDKSDVIDWINKQFLPIYANNEIVKSNDCYLLKRQAFENLQTELWFHDSALATESVEASVYGPRCLINSDSGSGCWYWLDSDCGTYVLGGRIYDNYEEGINVFYGCVRPVIILDFSNVKFENCSVLIDE